MTTETMHRFATPLLYFSFVRVIRILQIGSTSKLSFVCSSSDSSITLIHWIKIDHVLL